VHLTAKFHHPTFNRSEHAHKQTDKHTANEQTPLKTYTSLRYATPVGKKCFFYIYTLRYVSPDPIIRLTSGVSDIRDSLWNILTLTAVVYVIVYVVTGHPFS